MYGGVDVPLDHCIHQRADADDKRKTSYIFYLFLTILITLYSVCAYLCVPTYIIETNFEIVSSLLPTFKLIKAVISIFNLLF